MTMFNFLFSVYNVTFGVIIEKLQEGITEISQNLKARKRWNVGFLALNWPIPWDYITKSHKKIVEPSLSHAKHACIFSKTTPEVQVQRWILIWLWFFYRCLADRRFENRYFAELALFDLLKTIKELTVWLTVLLKPAQTTIYNHWSTHCMTGL